MAKGQKSAAKAAGGDRTQRIRDTRRPAEPSGKSASAASAATTPASTGLRLTVVIHPDADGGFWAEVPALCGCVSEGDSLDEVVANIREAAQGWLEVAALQNPPEADPGALIMELPL